MDATKTHYNAYDYDKIKDKTVYTKIEQLSYYPRYSQTIVPIPKNLHLCTKLRRLDFRTNGRRGYYWNYSSRGHGTLSSLATKKKFENKWDETMGQLTELEDLTINDTELDSASFGKILPKWTKLRILKIQKANLSQIEGILEYCPNLEELTLNACIIHSLFSEKHLHDFSKLKKLTIYNSNINRFTNFPKMENLEAMTFMNSKIKQELRIQELNAPKLKEWRFTNSSIAFHDYEISFHPDTQNVEIIHFHTSGLRPFKTDFSNLKNLQKINIYGNQIIEFPESLYQCKKLEEIEISNNNLSRIPEKLKELPKLKKLNIDNNPLSTFPDFLLDMDNISYPDYRGWRNISTYIQYYLANKVSKEDIRHFINFWVHQKETTCPIQTLFYFCRSNNEEILAGVIKEIKQRFNKKSFAEVPLNAESNVAFPCDYPGADVKQLKQQLENLDMKWSRKISKETTHVVLGQKMLKRNKYFDHFVFVTFKEVKDAVQKMDGSGYLLEKTEDTEQMEEGIAAMLMSKQEDSVSTAIELIKTGGFTSSLANATMYAYLNTSQSTVRKIIRDFWYTSELPKATIAKIKRDISHPDIHIAYGSEKRIRKKLFRYITKLEGFDAFTIAENFYKNQQRAYLFIMDYAPSDHKIKFLKQFVEGTTLKLSPMTTLIGLPKDIAHFKDIETVDLSGCNFVRFPAVLYKLPKLRKIDLRNNRLKALPKTSKSKLHPACEVLF
ncbi:MAG: hypothetical protein MK212_08530 [Saprospiraceae bacterium]|nr:hypothetical protein [Saprospiraceae bacterium]